MRYEINIYGYNALHGKERLWSDNLDIMNALKRSYLSPNCLMENELKH